MKIKQSKSVPNLSPKTSNQSKRNRLILLFSSLGFSILVSYFFWLKIQLNTAQQLVDDCSLNNNCAQVLVAVETLVKAQQSLKSFELSHTDLETANLSGADLYRTNLSHTNLEDANLKSTNLYRTNLGNANLSHADLERANLASAILINTKKLTPTQIKSACNWEKAFYQGRFDADYETWLIDKQANQQFIQLLQQAQDSDPKQPVDCSKWEHWIQVK